MHNRVENIGAGLLVQHISSGDPQNLNALIVQPTRSHSVVARLISLAVELSVHLDSQSGGWAIEVQNVAPDGMLTAKP